MVHRPGGGSQLGERYVAVGGGIAWRLIRSVTNWRVGVKFMVKKRYVTLEWPLSHLELSNFATMPSNCFFIMSLFYVNVPVCASDSH